MCTPCKILLSDKSLDVTGFIMSEDTSKNVWDLPLGEGWLEVTVHKIHDSDCPLIDR